MTRTTARRTTAAAALAALTLLAPLAPATAATQADSDPRGDLWEPSGDGGGETTWTSVGSKANGDVRAVKVTHSARRITIVTTYQSLNRTNPFQLDHRLRFDQGPELDAVVGTDPDGNSQADLTDGSTGDSVDCGGLDFTIDRAADKVTISVPRSCAGNPRWVETAGYNLVGLNFDTTDGGDDRIVYDVLRTRGHARAPWSDRVRKG